MRTQSTPTHKRCTKCEQLQPLAAFCRHVGRKDGLDTQCQPCKRDVVRRWRAESPLGQTRQREIERNVSESRRIIRAARDGGCTRCGESDPACLDFHHQDPAKKDANVARLGNTKATWSARGLDRLREEIAKCVVLCANCHRKLHAVGDFE